MLPYFMDLQMMVAVNALERTQPQYEALAAKAGWKLEKVWKTGKDGQGDGTYRHYEFRLSSEMVRKNRKRDDRILRDELDGDEKELVRAMRSSGLVGLRTSGGGSSGSSRSSGSMNGYRTRDLL